MKVVLKVVLTGAEHFDEPDKKARGETQRALKSATEKLQEVRNMSIVAKARM